MVAVEADMLLVHANVHEREDAKVVATIVVRKERCGAIDLFRQLALKGMEDANGALHEVLA